MKLKFPKGMPHLYVLPVVIYLLIFVLYPTIYVWYMSFNDFSGGKFKFIGLDNYISLARDRIFQRSLLNTLLYLCIAIGLEIPLGLGLALLLNQNFRGKALTLIVVMLPMILPPVMVALTFRMLYDPTLGLINYLLSVVNITGPTWLGEPGVAMLAVSLIDVWQWTPFVALILLAGLQYLPLEAFESALVDGASRLQVLRYITLPLLSRVILLALMFRVVDALKAFESIFITTRGGPGYATQTLNIYTFLTSFNYFHFGKGASLGLIMTFINIGLIMLLIRTIRTMA